MSFDSQLVGMGLLQTNFGIRSRFSDRTAPCLFRQWSTVVLSDSTVKEPPRRSYTKCRAFHTVANSLVFMCQVVSDGPAPQLAVLGQG